MIILKPFTSTCTWHTDTHFRHAAKIDSEESFTDNSYDEIYDWWRKSSQGF